MVGKQGSTTLIKVEDSKICCDTYRGLAEGEGKVVDMTDEVVDGILNCRIQTAVASYHKRPATKKKAVET